MDTIFLEEEVDILEDVLDNLDRALFTIEGLSSEEYKLTILQLKEVLNDLDYKLIDKQGQLEQYDEQRFAEERLGRYEKEVEHRYNKNLF